MTGMKSFWVVCITHMFVEVYLLTQVALIPVFIREFDMSLFEAALVATVPSLTQLFANLPSGFMAERFSTKKLLFTSMITEALSALLVSQAGNFWVLVLGVSIMRLFSPVYHVSGLSRISQLVEREKMNRSMGFHNALGSFGSAIGLIVLSIFLATIGWRWIYIFWAVPILIWGFIILKSEELGTKVSEDIGTEETSGLKLPSILSTAFIILLFAIGFRAMGYAGAQTYMTTYLVAIRDFSESMASLIFGFGTFIGILGSLNGGYLGEKMGAKKALSLAILCSAIPLSAMAFLTQFYLLAIAYLVFMFFSNSVWTPINAMVADLAPITGKGLSFSAYLFTDGVASSIAPLMAASIIGLYEMWYIFPFSVVFLIMGLITLQFLSYSR